MKLPEPYRACSCRDPGTGRLLGKSCPELERPGHGSWYARYEAPRTASQRRRQPRIGPYRTKKACSEALISVLGRLGQGVHMEDRRATFGDYLTRRLAWWESERELKPSTLASYREAIELYFRPGLGHVRLADLRDHHFRDLYAAMRLINRPGAGEQPSELLRRLLEARARPAHLPGRLALTRPLSDARIKRIHAVALSALSDTVPHTLPYNPAAQVKPGGKRGTRRRRPLLWTAPRVDRWLDTGEVPAPVMVWTREQCGAFLDTLLPADDLGASGERLYALYRIAAYCGLRRSELAGLAWPTSTLSGAACTSARRRSTTRSTPPRARTATGRCRWIRGPPRRSPAGAKSSSPSGWPGARPGPTQAACLPARTVRRCGPAGSASGSACSPPGPAFRPSGSTICGTAPQR